MDANRLELICSFFRHPDCNCVTTKKNGKTRKRKKILFLRLNFGFFLFSFLFSFLFKRRRTCRGMERATATSCKYAFLLSEGKKKSKEPELFLALLQGFFLSLSLSVFWTFLDSLSHSEKLESCGLGVEKKEIHVDKEGNATKASKSVRTVTGLVVWAPFQVLAKEAEKEGWFLFFLFLLFWRTTKKKKKSVFVTNSE